MITIFQNSIIFDGVNEDLIGDAVVVVENGRIKELGSGTTSYADAVHIDCAGRLLMPGLIDAHVHAYTPTANFFGNDHLPPALMANHAAAFLRGC